MIKIGTVVKKICGKNSMSKLSHKLVPLCGSPLSTKRRERCVIWWAEHFNVILNLLLIYWLVIQGWLYSNYGGSSQALISWRLFCGLEHLEERKGVLNTGRWTSLSLKRSWDDMTQFHKTGGKAWLPE